MAEPIVMKPNLAGKYYMRDPEEKRERSIGTKVTIREKRMLDEAVIECRMKGLPFKTPSDVVYWAFRRGMDVLKDDLKNEKFTNMYHQLNAEDSLIESSQIRRRWQNNFSLLEQEVEIHDQQGMGRYVPKLLREFEENLKLAPANPWVKKTSDQFYAKYGYRLKADRISSHPQDAEKEE